MNDSRSKTTLMTNDLMMMMTNCPGLTTGMPLLPSYSLLSEVLFKSLGSQSQLNKIYIEEDNTNKIKGFIFIQFEVKKEMLPNINHSLPDLAHKTKRIPGQSQHPHHKLWLLVSSKTI